MKAHHTAAWMLACSVLALAAPPAAVPAASKAPPPAPLLQYNQRYVMHQLDNDTIAVLDTAEGKVWTALIAQYGFKTWRVYDLNAVAKERNLADTPPAAFARLAVHARYNVRVFPGFVSFFDTLTGRVWTCRHSKGILDMWKCHNVATGAGDNEN